MQLFYYSKALVSVTPFQTARQSIMLLFNPFIDGTDKVSQPYLLIESTFVKLYCLLFTEGLISEYNKLSNHFLSIMDNHICRDTARWRAQGPEVAASLCAAMQDFGNPEALITKAFRAKEEKAIQTAAQNAEQNLTGQQQRPTLELSTPFQHPQELWSEVNFSSAYQISSLYSQHTSSRYLTFVDSSDVMSHALYVAMRTFTINLQRTGDENVLPLIHVFLAFIWSLAHVPTILLHIESHIPWKGIAFFLNTVDRLGVKDAHFEGNMFPPSGNGIRRQLPEDFVMRGLLWAQYYFPTDFFLDASVDEDERTFELPCHNANRAERCLWLGWQLASVSLLFYDNPR